MQPYGLGLTNLIKLHEGAKIAIEKLNELFQLFPLLEKELLKKNMGKDYVTLVFKNGSVFDVVSALDSQRGGRRHAGIIDECRDHDPDLLNDVVLPLMNVSRRTATGEIDPTEPNQGQLYITSASNKGCYAYEKLIELFIQSIIIPSSTFVWGMDYRVPMMHGLLSKSFIEQLKLSSTYKEESFAKEYLSIWPGGSSDSWIAWDKISKYRQIINPHFKQKNGVESNSFYYISVDVARTGVLTSVQIFQVVEKDTYYQKRLINSYAYHDMHFRDQSMNIKKLVRDYKPIELLIDGTGLGVGLADFLVLDQYDDVTGELLPGLSSNNNEDYAGYPGEKILYILKANSSLNSKIHGNCYAQIVNGHCRFLITEEEAKGKLNALKKADRIKPEEKIRRLSPHMECTKLIEEMTNLRMKNTGNDTVVERINGRINKDRFSAFEYGLWRIKEMEDEHFKNLNRRKIDFKNFVFHTRGGHK